MKQRLLMFPFFSLLLAVSSCITRTDVKDVSPEQQKHFRFLQHAEALKNFAEEKDACCGYGILIDMSIPSSEKRFFVVNFKNDSVVISGICAHGGGLTYNGDSVVFSNEQGSLCSSEGRYKIGAKYFGSFGLSYKLHGLDATNSNAYARFVVLHSMSCVPDEEGLPVCMSNGCAMVSPKVLKKTAALLDASDKPMLMWIYK